MRHTRPSPAARGTPTPDRVGLTRVPRTRARSHARSRRSVEADLRDRKEKALEAAGNLLGKGTSLEVAMDLDTGRGHAELSGEGANALTGKVKAVIGLFRGKRKSTKAGQGGTSVADHNEDTSMLNKKPQARTWSEWLQDKAEDWMSPENLEGRMPITQSLHKAVGATLRETGDAVGSAGLKGTWRVAVGWDLNFDDSGTCEDDCAAGMFEEDPMSFSIEAEAKVAAEVKLFGVEHKFGGGVSMSMELNTNGEVQVSANAKAQRSHDGHMTTYKTSAGVHGGGGGPTAYTASTSVSESMQDSTFARSPKVASLSVAMGGRAD